MKKHFVDRDRMYSTYQHHTGTAVYLASAVDARIVELERLLDVERRAVAVAHQHADIAVRWETAAKELAKRVDELEKALRAYIGFSREAANMIDADQEVKAFKLLIAMSGDVKNYRRDIDEARSVL